MRRHNTYMQSPTAPRLGNQGQETEMNAYRITSKASVDFGVYTGKTAEEAFSAMVAVGGGSTDVEGNPTAGTMADWIIEKITAYHLSTIGASAEVTGTLADAVHAAQRMDSEYQRAYGVTVEVGDIIVATICGNRIEYAE